MKRQYLGDSKDAFKWDYHDFLATRLGVPTLRIGFMMTPDDGSGQGKTEPSDFPARPEILTLCEDLRKSRDPGLVKALPVRTGASYQVALHKEDVTFSKSTRHSYFEGIDGSERQLLFLDPDNGFEPEKSCTPKHVSYSELENLLRVVSPDSVISVFHHFRRVSFSDDYASITQQLRTGLTTALYWRSLMLVTVCRSEAILRTLHTANEEYACTRPATVLLAVRRS
jgi:hypothetical protein